MNNKACLICGKNFSKPFKYSKTQWSAAKFCSRKCSGKNITPLKKQNFMKQMNKFLKTANLGKFGKLSSGWKGGNMIKTGYILVYSPNHPFAVFGGGGKKTKYMNRNRLIAEKYLKRYLTSVEVIHHIDGNRQNDNPKNLYLFLNQKEHAVYHNLKNKPKLTSNICS